MSIIINLQDIEDTLRECAFHEAEIFMDDFLSNDRVVEKGSEEASIYYSDKSYYK